MKRIAIKLVVFLLLGAVVNVGVAWGCASWSPGEDSSLTISEWQAPVPPDWPAEADLSVSVWTGLGVTETYALGDPPAGRDDLRNATQWVLRAGLPFHCLYLERHWTEEWATLILPLEMEAPRSWREGLPIPTQLPWTQPGRYLPTGVLPQRFAINTLLFGALLWLPFAPFATRRLIRKRCGRCLRCGYDLRHAEHDVCPECGAKGQR